MLIKNARTLEEKARKAFDLRNEYHSAARQYMSDSNLAEYLEQVEKNQVGEFTGKDHKKS